MRKLLGAIFGSAQTTQELVKGAVLGIDKMIFTKEEKAEASAALAEWWLKYLAATQPQNLARRLIALVVVLLWALLVLLGIALWKLDPGYSAFVFSTLDQIVNAPFLMIMGFYFAAHIVRTWQGGKD
ncbi:MAG: hypothetical protein JSW00_08945 [Thermoplasmata archaeon]|nr:MAG: hypothetical protein JSW00_08945 [Thermoplasmata archaeon]